MATDKKERGESSPVSLSYVLCTPHRVFQNRFHIGHSRPQILWCSATVLKTQNLFAQPLPYVFAQLGNPQWLPCLEPYRTALKRFPDLAPIYKSNPSTQSCLVSGLQVKAPFVSLTWELPSPTALYSGKGFLNFKAVEETTKEMFDRSVLQKAKNSGVIKKYKQN